MLIAIMLIIKKKVYVIEVDFRQRRWTVWPTLGPLSDAVIVVFYDLYIKKLLSTSLVTVFKGQ